MKQRDIKLINESDRYRVVIGRKGEYNTTTVHIDVSEIASDLAGCNIQVLHLPPCQEDFYAVTTTITNNVIQWKVLLTDTTYAGSGQLVIRFYVNGGLRKSATIETIVIDSNDDSIGDEPDTVTDWLTEFEEFCAGKIKDALEDKELEADVIEEMVNNYLDEHPVQGMTETQIKALIATYGFLTQHQSLEDYAKKTDVPYDTINQNTNARHSHSNMGALNRISTADISSWNSKADSGASYTKSESDAKYELKGQGGTSYDDTAIKNRIQAVEDKESTWDAKANTGDSYTKSESDAKYLTNALADSLYQVKESDSSALTLCQELGIIGYPISLNGNILTLNEEVIIL